jgi:hypothetical protein
MKKYNEKLLIHSFWEPNRNVRQGDELDGPLLPPQTRHEERRVLACEWNGSGDRQIDVSQARGHIKLACHCMAEPIIWFRGPDDLLGFRKLCAIVCP